MYQICLEYCIGVSISWFKAMRTTQIQNATTTGNKSRMQNLTITIIRESWFYHLFLLICFNKSFLFSLHLACLKEPLAIHSTNGFLTSWHTERKRLRNKIDLSALWKPQLFLKSSHPWRWRWYVIHSVEIQFPLRIDILWSTASLWSPIAIIRQITTQKYSMKWHF